MLSSGASFFLSFLSTFPLALGLALASSSFFLASSSAFFFASCSAFIFSGLFGCGGRIKVEEKYFWISAASLSNLASFCTGLPFLSNTTSSFFGSIYSSISLIN